MTQDKLYPNLWHADEGKVLQNKIYPNIYGKSVMLKKIFINGENVDDVIENYVEIDEPEVASVDEEIVEE